MSVCVAKEDTPALAALIRLWSASTSSWSDASGMPSTILRSFGVIRTPASCAAAKGSAASCLTKSGSVRRARGLIRKFVELYFPLSWGVSVRNSSRPRSGRVSRIGVCTPILGIAPGSDKANSTNLLVVSTAPQRVA